MSETQYPFAPKSTRLLERGQFWAIPLDGERYGAGCVLGSRTVGGKPSTRMFIAGVVQWCGFQPPTPEELHGLSVVKFGYAHIKTITESGGKILGKAKLQLSGTPISSESDSITTWGYGVPRIIAQRLAQNGG